MPLDMERVEQQVEGGREGGRDKGKQRATDEPIDAIEHDGSKTKPATFEHDELAQPVLDVPQDGGEALQQTVNPDRMFRPISPIRDPERSSLSNMSQFSTGLSVSLTWTAKSTPEIGDKSADLYPRRSIPITTRRLEISVARKLLPVGYHCLIAC
jgi:hypothetical protein